MTVQRQQVFASVAFVVAAGLFTPAAAQPTPQDRVAAIKQALADSMAALRQYEWVETTIISLKGEEKSRTQQRCYYGADGTIQKIALTQAAEPEQERSGGRGRGGGRLRKRIVERKTEEITEYMQQAAQMVHAYLPPDPVLIQKSKDADKVTVQPLDGGRVRIAIGDYVRPGDALTIELDAAANRLLTLGVATYIEDVDDTVGLTVTFGELNGSIGYQSEIVLEAPSKNVTVVVQNSGHRKLAQ